MQEAGGEALWDEARDLIKGREIPSADRSRFFSLVSRAADEGSPRAMFALGVCYRDAIGCLKDISKSIEWFELALSRGEAEAAVALGYIYDAGKSVARDRKRAVDYWEQALEMGDTDIRPVVAIAYYTGNNRPRDYQKALDILSRYMSIKANEDAPDEELNSDAFLTMGILLESGDLDVVDYPLALANYEIAARLGEVEAMAYAGDFYQEGKGCERDRQAALKWITKAAELGHHRSLYNYASALTFGDGIRRNKKAARSIFKRLLRSDNPEIQHDSRIMLRNEFGMLSWLLSRPSGNASPPIDNGRGSTTCSFCNGTRLVSCSRCFGTGIAAKGISSSRLSIKEQDELRQVAESETRCTSCNGSGKVSCLTCH